MTTPHPEAPNDERLIAELEELYGGRPSIDRAIQRIRELSERALPIEISAGMQGAGVGMLISWSAQVNGLQGLRDYADPIILDVFNAMLDAYFDEKQKVSS